MTRTEALTRVLNEYSAAAAKHDDFNSAHEGWGILYEEVDELWGEVKLHTRDPKRMADEAAQVAAMALRFLTDCC